MAGEQFESLYQYYRNLYKKVTEEDIEAVEAEYRGSEEETADVLKYYQQFKGDMNQVQTICLSSSNTTALPGLKGLASECSAEK